jgi:hypothetical protein
VNCLFPLSGNDFDPPNGKLFDPPISDGLPMGKLPILFPDSEPPKLGPFDPKLIGIVVLGAMRLTLPELKLGPVFKPPRFGDLVMLRLMPPLPPPPPPPEKLRAEPPKLRLTPIEPLPGPLASAAELALASTVTTAKPRQIRPKRFMA